MESGLHYRHTYTYNKMRKVVVSFIAQYIILINIIFDLWFIYMFIKLYMGVPVKSLIGTGVQFPNSYILIKNNSLAATQLPFICSFLFTPYILKI